MESARAPRWRPTASLASLEYTEMLRLLEKRGWTKAASQTPLEFAAADSRARSLRPRHAIDRAVPVRALRQSPGAGRTNVVPPAFHPRFPPHAQAVANMKWRLAVLIGAIVRSLPSFLFPAIPQNEAYHNFADKRALFGIPNGLDVVSNLFFLVVGVWGLQTVWGGAEFLDPRERWPYAAFFIGVTLTAFGSSWYHLNPNDATLVWDRIPMAIGFMALVAAVIAERVRVKTGLWLLAPLIGWGIASVIYWEVTEQHGRGDLRPYALTQFGSLAVLLLLIALFPARYTRSHDLGISLALYVLGQTFRIRRPANLRASSNRQWSHVETRRSGCLGLLDCAHAAAAARDSVGMLESTVSKERQGPH